MKVEFLPEAEEEFREAVRYYEQEAPGVGLTFLAEVRSATISVLQNPHSAADIGNGIRRKVLHHFPYNLIYSIESDLIIITAVAHHKRRPRYWKGRIKK